MRNWNKMYYKLRQVLQIRATITNWGIAILKSFKFLTNNLYFNVYM